MMRPSSTLQTQDSFRSDNKKVLYFLGVYMATLRNKVVNLARRSARPSQSLTKWQKGWVGLGKKSLNTPTSYPLIWKGNFTKIGFWEIPPKGTQANAAKRPESALYRSIAGKIRPEPAQKYPPTGSGP